MVMKHMTDALHTESQALIKPQRRRIARLGPGGQVRQPGFPGGERHKPGSQTRAPHRGINRYKVNDHCSVAAQEKQKSDHSLFGLGHHHTVSALAGEIIGSPSGFQSIRQFRSNARVPVEAGSAQRTGRQFSNRVPVLRPRNSEATQVRRPDIRRSLTKKLHTGIR